MVPALVAVSLAGCSGGEACDEDALSAFRGLDAPPGVSVDPQPSPGIGCTDTVTVDDPDAVVEHYRVAMNDLGWTVTRTERGVFGRTAGFGITVDRLEGNDVGVYLLGPDELG